MLRLATEHETEIAAEILSMLEEEPTATSCAILSAMLEALYGLHVGVDGHTACRKLSKIFADMAAKRKVDWSFGNTKPPLRRPDEQRPPTAGEVEEANTAPEWTLQLRFKEVIETSNIADPVPVARALLHFLVSWIGCHESDWDKALRITGQMLKQLRKQRYLTDERGRILDVERKEIVSPATVN